jgi:integrase
MGYVYQRDRVWWIAYWWRGEKRRESSRSSKRKDAVALLKRRVQEIGKGRFIDPRAEEKLMMNDLFDDVVTDYKNNKRRSLATLEDRLIPLRAAFGMDRAVDVDETRIEKYKAERLATTRRGGKLVAAGTANRELAALRRAFRLGFKRRRLSRVPEIEMLAEAEPRESFVEPYQFEKIHGELPDYLRDPAHFGYIVGWRKGAVTGLRWEAVDRENRRVYLRRSGSKNKKPYVLVLTGELAAIFDRRWKVRTVTRPDGTTFLSEYVFHREGERVGDFRKAWATACERAGTPGTLFHDFRRSAARNLRRAHGIGPEVGMKITGHETASMWRRYSIVNDDDVEQALNGVQAYISEMATQKTATKVVSMEARR